MTFLLYQDHNFGLVNQVVSSMYKRNIQILTQTYLTLSLQDIASRVQLNSAKEAEMHVLKMVTMNIHCVLCSYLHDTTLAILK